jgi:hypothetical protein
MKGLSPLASFSLAEAVSAISLSPSTFQSPL